MRMPLVTAFLLAGVLLAAISGCSKVSTAEAVKFNDALVAANKRLSQAGKEFGEAAVKAIEGQTLEVAMAKRAFVKVSEAMESVNSEMRLIKVPDSPSGRKFHEEYLALLKTEEQMVKDDLGAIMRLLENPAQTPAMRQRKIVPIARYLDQMDDQNLARIRQVQAAFAKEHGFKIK